MSFNLQRACNIKPWPGYLKLSYQWLSDSVPPNFILFHDKDLFAWKIHIVIAYICYFFFQLFPPCVYEEHLTVPVSTMTLAAPVSRGIDLFHSSADELFLLQCGNCSCSFYSLHNWLAKVYNQLVRFFFKYLLSYITFRYICYFTTRRIPSKPQTRKRSLENI